LVLVSSCKQLQENQAVPWILKTKEKNPPKQESLVFLEMTLHRVGEKAENQRKTREKSKEAENQVFWLDFLRQIKGLCIPSQGENQGSRKPSVLVGFMRQKKGLCITSLLFSPLSGKHRFRKSANFF
jgi:hypothetical protein